MARTLRLQVEYDGTDFSGWQFQDGQRTVQGCIEDAFKAMTGAVASVRGAGRTDAGVHAVGQVANVDVDGAIPCGGYLRGLNSHLPPDIAIVSVDDAPEQWSSRFAARGKVYRFAVWNHPIRAPLVWRTSWHIRRPLDVAAMRTAAQIFVGEHDFAAFRASDCERRTTVRTLHRFDVWREGGMLYFEVEGTAFLKNMVRILVGTLVEVGRGKVDLAALRQLKERGDRTRAGMTAPAHGLTLMRVIY